MLDLDKFKEINDTEGHAAGDELLRWAVGTMKQAIRPMDTIGRIGGDEFAILLPGAAPSDTERVANRLQTAMAERAPTSIGMACFPIDGADQSELMRLADNELYARKHGRGAQLRGVPTADSMSLSWATALAHAVDERITVQQAHSRKVAAHSKAMAKALGWSDEECEQLGIAAVLHDIGKVAVPDRILRKEEPLMPEEWAEVERHPKAGAEIVARIKGLERTVPWIHHTRENWDGSGYPDGLKGEEIPVGARILHVASAFDAMTAGRPYRAPLSIEEALAELTRKTGTQFDPEMVALFEREVVPTLEPAEAAEAAEA
jgi:HD-GYP domain-containing protein (c-di-GMP phosphodiesterase class II)